MTSFVTTSAGGSFIPSNLPSPAKFRARIEPPPRQPPLFISTNPRSVNPHRLRELFAASNYSCTRSSSAANVSKLGIAVSHSSIVVSAFTRAIGSQWIERFYPPGRLIGFGRAVSDMGLTASIYDIVVHPDFRGRGIGKTILERILRELRDKDIHDISVLSGDENRPFFSACGFGDDLLGSTTMIYNNNGRKNRS